MMQQAPGTSLSVEDDTVLCSSLPTFSAQSSKTHACSHGCSSLFIHSSCQLGLELGLQAINVVVVIVKY